MAEFSTREEALASVRPGWTIKGQRPYLVTTTTPVPNPLPGQPTTTTTQTQVGTILVIQGPNGEPDEMTIASTPPAQRGEPPKITILQGPGAKPDAIKDKPSGKYTNVIDPNDSNNKRVIGMVDTGDGSFHTVSSDPNLPGRQIITTPTAVYAVDAENNVKKLVDIDKQSPFQAVIVDGKPYRFDPNAGTFTAGPVNAHPDIKDQNGLVMTWQGSDEEGQYGYPPGVKPAAGLSVNTQAPNLIWYDNEGNVVSTRPNENYRPAAPALPQVGANAPMVPIEDPDKPGQIKWVPNQGQVMAGEALQNLAAQLTKTVVDPAHPLTLDQAKTMIEAANQRMTTEASQAQTARGAAGDILSAQSAGAQTGAGMLQQRQQTAQNLVQQGLGIATSAGGRYGNYSGGMLSPVPGLGQNLAQGAAGFATELGGGQAVYDTAIRMVQAADPNNQNPDRAAAVATLTQLMDRYKQASGQDHPAVAATQALQASQASGGMAGPQTLNPAAVTPDVFQAQFDPRLNPAAPQQPAGTVLPPGVAGTVAPGDPRYVGTLPTMAQARTPAQLGFTAPGAIMGMVGPMAMAANR